MELFPSELIWFYLEPLPSRSLESHRITLRHGWYEHPVRAHHPGFAQAALFDLDLIAVSLLQVIDGDGTKIVAVAAAGAGSETHQVVAIEVDVRQLLLRATAYNVLVPVLILDKKGFSFCVWATDVEHAGDGAEVDILPEFAKVYGLVFFVAACQQS